MHFRRTVLSAACAFLLASLDAHAQDKGDAAPSKWTGAMEEGRFYRAPVALRAGIGWWPEGLVVPQHHAVRVEWLNLDDFARIPKAAQPDTRMTWTWAVVSKKVWKVHGRREWRTLLRCRVARVESAAREARRAVTFPS